MNIKNKSRLLVRFLTLGDQACFSVSNFLLSVILARLYSETELAAFVIGLSIALTIQGVQRNCYVVQNAVLASSILRRRTSKVLGQQSIVWITLILIEGIAALCIGLWGGSEYYTHIAVATIIATLIHTQLEFDRIIFMKHEKYFHAAIASAGFLFLIICMFFAVPYFGVTFYALMGLIAVYMILKMLWLFISTSWPDFFWGWRLLKRDFRRYFTSSLVGVIGYSGHNHIPVMILGWFAAPIQAAVFGAMRGLMQPMQIVIRSLDIVDKNFFQARVSKAGGVRAVLRHQLFVYGGLSVCVILGAVLFGTEIISLTYGEKYAGYDFILIGWSFIFAMLTITFPLETVIISAGKLNQYNYSRIISGVVGVVLSLLLWKEYGALGAVIASFSGWIVTVIVSFYIVRGILNAENAKMGRVSNE